MGARSFAVTGPDRLCRAGMAQVHRDDMDHDDVDREDVVSPP
ncbi:hypothetical protein [Streptomyces sp. 8N616]